MATNSLLKNENLINELNLIKQDSFSFAAQVFIFIKNKVFLFLISYKEYSYQNIKAIGLTQILMERALRFFRLDFPEYKRRIKQKVKKGIKKIFKTKSKRIGRKHLLKLLFTPIYFFILLLLRLRKGNYLVMKKKKNIYRK